VGEGYTLSGSIKTRKRSFNPELTIDKDERIIGGNCDCSFYVQNKLYKGPCEHMLALRLSINKIK
jgi:predicted nucleic acid-binding Zn finger protein